nr:AMP-binding protein [Roseomonas acroporae]
MEGTAARHPGATALVGAARRLDYATFAAASRRVAEALSRQGIGPGDRVAVWLPNRPEFLVLLFALARLGACAVFVNTRFRGEEVSSLIDRARPSALVTAWGFAPVDFPALLEGILPDARAPLRFVVGVDAPEGAAAVAGLPVLPWEALELALERAADDAAPDAACLTFTTSGTTAGPKLVLHRQRAVAGHALDVMRGFGTDAPEAAALSAIPLCGTFGLTLAMAAIAGGARIVTMDRFDAAEADALIRRERVTHSSGGDDLAERLIEAAAGRPYDVPLLFGFGAFRPGADAVVARGDAIGLRCRGVYGSSEVQALFSLQPADSPRRAFGGGIPVGGAEIRVRDAATGGLAAPGVNGELEFRAPSLFAGYLNNPEATAKAMTADGFFRSGDLGRIEPEGSPAGGFGFEARIGDTLRLGGFLVNPEEIEGFLKRQPGVAEAQVVGVEGDPGGGGGGGTAAVAFVQAAAGAALSEPALLAACRDGLARFKVPARIVTVESFPVTESPNGPKIQRVRLREMAAALPAAAAELAAASPG